MALKVKADGGEGIAWDDECEDYEDVTKVYVRGGLDGIQSIQFEYVKAGNKTIVGPIHGSLYRHGFTQTFEINHAAHEYLLSVEGYYKKHIIQSVQFRTNMKTSDLMGYDEGIKFSLRSSGRKIIGFHGSAMSNLYSLGAYFIKIPSIKSTIQGGTTTGTVFDDGGDFDGIRKVYVSHDGDAVRHIKFVYDKAGQVKTHEHGVKTGILYEFRIYHPNEYLSSVEVTYSYNYDVLTSFVFKTSKGRISPLIGRVGSEKFVLENKGSAIVGFHGRIGSCVEGLGAYYNPIPPSPLENSLDEDLNQYTKALKVEAKGRKGGSEWDDGSDYEDITKIHVQIGLECIQSIKFDYAKDGKTFLGINHGFLIPRESTQTFEIDHEANEYLLSVEGYYKESTGVIQSFIFKTNRKTSNLIGHNEGIKFSLRASGRKIIGFHGFAEYNLNSLGAYFIKSPSIKNILHGGKVTGRDFDDGGDFDGIRKVYVTHDGNAVRHIKFDYDKAGQVETREYGVKTGSVHEFAVDHPNEYLASVEGTYGVTSPYGSKVLNSLVFKTSTGRSSPLIGRASDRNFVMERKGHSIVGFHGMVDSCVYSIGAYYNPIPPSPLEYSSDEDSNQKYTKEVLKVEAKDGNAWSEWNDGSDYEDITKIHVQSGLEGIKSIKFDYAKDGKTFFGLIHGVRIVGGLTQTFEINHAANEYLLSVEGYYKESTDVIQSLKFKTNKNTFDIIGNNEGTQFSVRASGRKIIGFLGYANANLNSLGAYFIKIPSIKSAIQGGITTGSGFDDGGDFDGIRKVYVTFDGNAIRHIKLDYDKDGQVEKREHGVKTGTVYEFTVNHPNEYLVSVEGTYDVTSPYGYKVLSSFIFKTSSGRTSTLIGRVADKRLLLESKDNAIVGFHGRVGPCIYGLGAYYNPIHPSSSLSDEL